MTATNGLGYEIIAYDNKLGWGLEAQKSNVIYPTQGEAETELVVVRNLNDGIDRRVAEVLDGFPTQCFPIGYAIDSSRVVA